MLLVNVTVGNQRYFHMCEKRSQCDILSSHFSIVYELYYKQDCYSILFPLNIRPPTGSSGS